ncbi:MAG: type II toxin-antitoxin system VapC family toxin [Dermatophilaceae bacterium]
MTTRAVVDTSVLIGDDVDVIPGHLAISVVSMAELQFGVLVATDDEVRAHRLQRLSRLRRFFDPLPVDDAVADSYGQLAARVTRHGRQPRARQFDLLIAATAHAHDAQLITRNPKDFRGLEDLIHVAAP